MKPFIFAVAMSLTLPAVAQHAHPPATARQAEVGQRGAEVMPFSLGATTHVFTKSADGGTQRVIAKNPADAGQVSLVRQHLQQIRDQFERGDFSAPAHIHGAEMPGLAALRAAQPGQVLIDYREVSGGAQLSYHSQRPELVTALHQWFDAQLSDHGSDAMAGHHGH